MFLGSAARIARAGCKGGVLVLSQMLYPSIMGFQSVQPYVFFALKVPISLLSKAIYLFQSLTYVVLDLVYGARSVGVLIRRFKLRFRIHIANKAITVISFPRNCVEVRVGVVLDKVRSSYPAFGRGRSITFPVFDQAIREGCTLVE